MVSLEQRSSCLTKQYKIQIYRSSRLSNHNVVSCNSNPAMVIDYHFLLQVKELLSGRSKIALITPRRARVNFEGWLLFFFPLWVHFRSAKCILVWKVGKIYAIIRIVRGWFFESIWRLKLGLWWNLQNCLDLHFVSWISCT